VCYQPAEHFTGMLVGRKDRVEGVLDQAIADD
jgi:hypothetical protein